MNKLLALLFLSLISINSHGDELNSLFGIDLYENAKTHFSSNYIDSNKYKNTETIDGYFNVIVTKKIKITSPYISDYLLIIDSANKIHSIGGNRSYDNLDICQAIRENLVSSLEDKHQIDFKYWENAYPTFKVHSSYFFSSSSNKYGVQCSERYSDSGVFLQIYMNSNDLMTAIDDFYESGL